MRRPDDLAPVTARVARIACTAWIALAACTGDRDGPIIASASPPHAPLGGGTRITIVGAGFEAAAQAEVRFGDRPAPLIAIVDDDTLDVVVPPGVAPGPAEVTVVIGDRVARSARVFHYSAPPTIASVTPADVLHDAAGAILTVTGSGFADEDAGPPTVVVGGIGVVTVVESDTVLAFVAPRGRPLHEPDVELVNQRGTVTHRRAFRYVPSHQPGLLLVGGLTSFAAFVDPVAGDVVDIPRVSSSSRITSMIRDARGGYWGADRLRRIVGHLDLSAQQVEATFGNAPALPAMARMGDAVFALDRDLRRFGRLELETTTFTPLGEVLPCCGSYGLASDGERLYLAAREGGVATITTVDPTTGERAPAIPLVGVAGLHLEDVRFFAGVLYGIDRSGRLVTIDPTTGATTVLPFLTGRFRAMEVFE